MPRAAAIDGRKVVNKTIENKTKEQKDGILDMLLGILGTSLLETVSAGKGATRVGEEIITVGENF